MNEYDRNRHGDCALEICRRLGIGEDVLAFLREEEGGPRFTWSDVFSSTECELLSLARALITNPNVLCIQKPVQNFDAATARHVTQVLREFVDSKGIARRGRLENRRPRTCIVTGSARPMIDASDKIYHIAHCTEGARGTGGDEAMVSRSIKEVTKQEALDLDGRGLHVMV